MGEDQGADVQVHQGGSGSPRCLKSSWESLNGDLEYAKSSIEELFYLLPLDTEQQVEAMVEIAEVVQKIPSRTEQLLQEATQEGYQQYVRESSWDSWKRKGVK